MSVVGALAAAFALFAAQVDPQKAGPSMIAAPTLVTTLAAVPGLRGTYFGNLFESLCEHGAPVANGPARDGMSLRDLRPRDLTNQTTLPLLAGRF